MELVVRRGPICGAQHWLWLLDTLMSQRRNALPPAYFRVDVPPGLDLPTLRAALARLVERHEALRTTIRRGSDGWPVQVVHATAEPDLLIVGAEDPELTGTVPAEVLAAEVGGFPLHVRCRVVHGVVVEVLVRCLAAAVDGASLARLQEDLGELITARLEDREPAAAGTAAQPVDRADAEAAGTVRPAGDRALRHWTRQLRIGPHASLPFHWNRSIYWQDAPPEGRCLQTTMISQGFAERCRVAARRYRVTVPTLVQSLTVAVLAGWTGQSACAFGVVFANRSARETVDSVGRYATEMRVVVDLEGDPRFSVVTRRVFSTLVTAYSNGIFDVGALVMAEARESLRIGARFSTSVIMECHTHAAGSPLPPGLRTEGPLDLHQTVIDYRTPNLRCDISLVDEQVTYVLRCPESLLPPAAATAFMQALSAVLDAVLSEADPSLSRLVGLVDLPAPWRGPGWVMARNALINLDVVADLLVGHDAVSTAVVFPVTADPAGDGPTLEAYLVPEGRTPSLAEVGEYARDAIAHHPDAMVPHRFVICATAPTDRKDLAAWQRQPVIAAGPSEAAGPAHPMGLAEEDLAAVFEALHPNRPVLMTQTYSQLFGEFLLIPTMLERLASAGYGGLGLGDFIGMASMRRVAAKMAAGMAVPLNNR